MNDQRKEVYAQRKEFMRADDVSEIVTAMRAEVIGALVARRVPEKAFAEQWELAELAADLRRVLNLDLPVEEWGREEGIDEVHLRERIEQAADQMMAAKAANLGPEWMRFVEKAQLIQTLDAVWKEHLYALDHLRQGIGLRAYGQKDPLNEYKAEAFALFNAMLDELKERVTSELARVDFNPDTVGGLTWGEPQEMSYLELHPDPGSAFGGLAEAGGDLATLAAPTAALATATAQPLRAEPVDPADPSTWRATPRNAPCPCGSGRKYKHCHGKLG
jgi:preprotein translocase subunit SecA